MPDSAKLMDRRHLLVLLGSSLASPALAQAPAMSKPTAYAFSFAGLDGATLSLEDPAKPKALPLKAQGGRAPLRRGLRRSARLGRILPGERA